MRRKVFTVLLFASLLSGCSTGYKIIENKVVYKTVDERRGTAFQAVPADAKTFEVLGTDNIRWARDAGHVFYKGALVIGVESSSFVVLNKYYGKDALSAVGGCRIITDANVETFLALDNIIIDNIFRYTQRTANEPTIILAQGALRSRLLSTPIMSHSKRLATAMHVITSMFITWTVRSKLPIHPQLKSLTGIT